MGARVASPIGRGGLGPIGHLLLVSKCEVASSVNRRSFDSVGHSSLVAVCKVLGLVTLGCHATSSKKVRQVNLLEVGILKREESPMLLS